MWTASEDGFVKVGVLSSGQVPTHCSGHPKWCLQSWAEDSKGRRNHLHHRFGTFGRVGVSGNTSRGRLSTPRCCTRTRASSSQVPLAGLTFTMQIFESAPECMKVPKFKTGHLNPGRLHRPQAMRRATSGSGTSQLALAPAS